MNRFVLAGLGSSLTLALLAEDVRAHGGWYPAPSYPSPPPPPGRGPGDVVPPSPGGGRGPIGGGPTAPQPGNPTTPGPGGPAAPGPAAPAAPGPSTPGAGLPAPGSGGGGPTTPRGLDLLQADFTTWDYWWEFNKDPYIRLKDAIHARLPTSGSDEYFLGATRRVETFDTMGPTEADRRDAILPALKKAIDSTDNRDITSSCMVAMAKVGIDHPEFTLREVFLPRLQRHDQEIRETAALAFGIAALGRTEDVALLAALVEDNKAGREACRQAEVSERTRAFAAYGLGLLAHASTDVRQKRSVFEALRAIVDSEEYVLRNLKVAAVNAIALLNVRPDHAGTVLLADALACLQRFYSRDLEAGRQLLQAHVPPAVAKLLRSVPRDSADVARWKELFAADLAADLTAVGERRRSNSLVAASCALALGQLCAPCADETAADIEHCKTLLRAWKEHRDQQTRYFAVLALGQIGGAWTRSALLRAFDGANKAIEKPWVALAMGVQAFEQLECEQQQGRRGDPDHAFGETLRKALDTAKDPDSAGAFAVALGLCRYDRAADDLRARLLRSKGQDKLAGHLCIGLALMGELGAREEIHEIVRTSVRRPELLRQAAIALGRLGDKTVTLSLHQRLLDPEASLAEHAAIASALGFIGDRSTILPLQKMLADGSLTELSRAFAAVALGGVGDKESLPWNSKIGVNMNYRAAVETLLGSSAGILDIL